MIRTAVGPLAWTFPVAVVLGGLSTWAWLMFALLSRRAPISCEYLDRSAWLAAAAFATAAACLPMTLTIRPSVRALLALLGAILVGTAAWFGTAVLFPGFC